MATQPLPTSDPEPASAELPEGPLTFVDEGPREAPALIALHGIPGSHRDFRYLAPQLTERVRLVRADLPGFGGSAPVRDAIESLSGRARAVLVLAEHLRLRRFGVLGHSMGGATAVALASEHPGRVSHLVLVSSVALSRHRGLALPPWAFALLSRGVGLPLLGRLVLRQTRRQYRKHRFPGAETLDAATARLHLRAIAAMDFGRIRRAAQGPLPPTLIAYARDDRLLETRISEELARALPAARALAFDAGGHNLQKTRALELGAAIREWLGAGG